MHIRHSIHLAASLAAALAAAACGDDSGEGDLNPGCDVTVSPGGDDQTAVQTALIEAAPGATVCLAAGTFSFKTELSLDVDGVTVTGEGQGKTVLDFSTQDTGANGLLLRGDGIVIQDLDIRNTPGDGIRADSVAGVSFLRVSVLWDADGSMDNGAYGLYPVNSTDVVIDSCLVKGARDAGIYVGQSQGVLVVSSEAYGNVAGIEIENTTDAIVRDNYAHDNSGGILVFNLPGLPVKDGKRANLFNNRVENNNHPNFGVAGTTVAKVPPGLGVMILASDDNEVHDNQITGNNSSAILIASYITDLFGPNEDPEFDAYPQGNFVHDNTLESNGTDPAPIVSALSALRPIPDVLWDGCIDAAAADDGHLTNCISEPAATYLNFNYCNDFPDQSQDITPVACTYEPLPTE